MTETSDEQVPLGFELWGEETRNALGGYETEAAALAAAAEIVANVGPEHMDSLVLVRVGPKGGLKRIADGADLALRARASVDAAQRVAIAS